MSMRKNYIKGNNQAVYDMLALLSPSYKAETNNMSNPESKMMIIGYNNAVRKALKKLGGN